MTANSVLPSNFHRFSSQDFLPHTKHTIALLVAMWFLAKVVPVFTAIQSAVGLDATQAGVLNSLSWIATQSGIWLLPLCLIGQVAAGFRTQPGSDNHSQRSWKVAFEGTLCAVILVPFLTFLTALLRFWLTTSF